MSKTVETIDNLYQPYTTNVYTPIKETNYLEEFLGDDYNILTSFDVPTLEDILEGLKTKVITIQ